MFERRGVVWGEESLFLLRLFGSTYFLFLFFYQVLGEEEEDDPGSGTVSASGVSR